MDQGEIDKAAKAALKSANFRVRLDIFYEAEGIRPVDIPEDAEERIAQMITPRLPPSLGAAGLEYPGRWRLTMRAIQIEASQRIDG